ncbi:unnamed protein product [Larinioides sclopetarius]|uniref:Uncharacterized protein n=1 Tax=Larinioides sclopetarius TaxID=280406 RepID=A0AAV1ZAJ0_9ARAC
MRREPLKSRIYDPSIMPKETASKKKRMVKIVTTPENGLLTTFSQMVKPAL